MIQWFHIFINHLSVECVPIVWVQEIYILFIFVKFKVSRGKI